MSPKVGLEWKASAVHAAKKRRRLLLSTPAQRAFQTAEGCEASCRDESGSSQTSPPKQRAKKNHLGDLALEFGDAHNAGRSAFECSKLMQEEGNRLAEEGDFAGALKKWEKAIFLTPERAVQQEQKAQILLEMNSVWNALQSATRAVELDPNWAEAHLTLARCQLNLGEPSFALKSFLHVQHMKPELDISAELTQARHLVAMQQSLSRSLPHFSGSSSMASPAHSRPRRAFVIDGTQPPIPPTSLPLPPSSSPPASSPTPSASPPMLPYPVQEKLLIKRSKLETQKRHRDQKHKEQAKGWQGTRRATNTISMRLQLSSTASRRWSCREERRVPRTKEHRAHLTTKSWVASPKRNNNNNNNNSTNSNSNSNNWNQT